MKRRTIDYGIDLGTTNSAIALFENGTCTIFRNYSDDELTPSVVRLDESGAIIVGKRAYRHLAEDGDNTVGGFKRWMGTQQNKKFIRSGRVITPEELSAEVLKELKIAVRSSRNEDIKACVITVPASFEVLQCDATQRAARLAGIEHSPLLQEPIAAAIAYGLQKNTQDGYWLVYDLGGGTFDVALVSLQQGQLSILDHEGNNYLGGSDFDSLIVDSIVIPFLKSQFDLEDLSFSNTKKYGALIACAKSKAEEAKIELSRRDESIIEIQSYDGSMKDNKGKQINARIPLTKKQYEPLIQGDIKKTIKLCEKVLNRQHLKSNDIQKMILVGGPTRTPYLRQLIQQELGINLEFSINPMTVVAQGAAIVASSQFVPTTLVETDKNKMQVDLQYDPMTNVTEPMISGTIPDYQVLVKNKGQISLMLRRQGGDWQSGKLNVQKDGKFAIRVHLNEGKQNTFYLTFFDEFGNAIPSEPESIQISHGISIADAPVIASIGVALENGNFSAHIEKGESLPARGMQEYKTSRVIKSGTDDEGLKIYVYEGEYKEARNNQLTGFVRITGKDVSRDIPEGARIEVTLRSDEQRHVTVSCEVMGEIIPEKSLFDENGQLAEIWSPKPNIDKLEKEIQKQKERLQEIKQVMFINKDVAGDMADTIRDIEQQLESQALNRDILAARGGDQTACEKLDREVKDLRGGLDRFDGLKDWQLGVVEYKESMKAVEWALEKFGLQEDREKNGVLQSEFNTLSLDKNYSRLKKLIEEVWSFYWAICMRKNEWWISQFNNFKKEEKKFSNPDRAKTLLTEGSHALQGGDIESLKEIMFELWNLVSRDAQKESSMQVIDSGLRR